MVTRKQASENSRRKVTVTFGYGLFAVAVLAVIVVTIIPYGTLLLNPSVKHLNVATMLFAFVAAAIVPFLVAYIIGDKATRTKDKLAHHYNGVLFGILAYWLSQLFGSIEIFPLPIAQPSVSSIWVLSLANIWPILASIIVIAIIATRYHTRKQKAGESALQYAPYRILLFIAVAATLILSYGFIADEHLLIGSFLAIGIPLALIGISYIVIAKSYSDRQARLAIAIAAVSFGYIAMNLGAQLAYNINYSATLGLLTTVLGFIVWVAYMWLIRRSGQSTK